MYIINIDWIHRSIFFASKVAGIQRSAPQETSHKVVRSGFLASPWGLHLRVSWDFWILQISADLCRSRRCVPDVSQIFFSVLRYGRQNYPEPSETRVPGMDQIMDDQWMIAADLSPVIRLFAGLQPANDVVHLCLDCMWQHRTKTKQIARVWVCNCW